jgi:hypothetical protein
MGPVFIPICSASSNFAELILRCVCNNKKKDSSKIGMRENNRSNERQRLLLQDDEDPSPFRRKLDQGIQSFHTIQRQKCLLLVLFLTFAVWFAHAISTRLSPSVSSLSTPSSKISPVITGNSKESVIEEKYLLGEQTKLTKGTMWVSDSGMNQASVTWQMFCVSESQAKDCKARVTGSYMRGCDGRECESVQQVSVELNDLGEHHEVPFFYSLIS